MSLLVTDLNNSNQVVVTTSTLTQVNVPNIKPVEVNISSGNPINYGGGREPIEYKNPTPSTTFTINHNLGYKPIPSFYNLAYEAIEVAYQHFNDNTLLVFVNPASPLIVLY